MTAEGRKQGAGEQEEAIDEALLRVEELNRHEALEKKELKVCRQLKIV